MARPPIAALTGVRFFAALAVLAFHLSNEIKLPRPLAQIAAHGRAGVSFFFVLSGFLLTLKYSDWFGAGVRGRPFYLFWRARLARLYPLHLIVLLLVTPFIAYPYVTTYLTQPQVASPGHPFLTLLASWLASAFLLQVYVPTYLFEQLWNGPAWSIASELFFYTGFPFLIAGLLKERPSRQRIFTLLLVFYVIEAALFFGAVAQIKNTATSASQAWLRLDFIPYRMPFFRIWEFAIGCGMGAWFLHHPPRFLATEKRRNLSLILLSGGIALVMTGVRFHDPGIFAVHWYLAYTPLFAAMILCLAAGPCCLSAILTHPLVLLLGEASYALYLIQKPAIILLYKMGFQRFSVAFGAAIAVACIGLSVFFFKVVESPARRVLRGPRA